MVTIIAGSRTIADPRALLYAIERSGFAITEVVSGGAGGVDSLGEQWAAARSIPVKRFPADWRRHGRSAGARRNRQMVDYAAQHHGALLAVWDGVSRGTAMMIDLARKSHLKVYVARCVHTQNRLQAP